MEDRRGLSFEFGEFGPVIGAELVSDGGLVGIKAYIVSHSVRIWIATLTPDVIPLITECDLRAPKANYPIRNACTGSTRNAFNAGTAQEIMAVSKRPPIMMKKITGSTGLVP